MRIVNGKREIEVGDAIHCKGFRAIVNEIVFQDFFGADGFEIEFIDSEGKCRVWKQRFDHGYVIPKIGPVPEEVVRNIRRYFAENLACYEVMTVERKSEHPDDWYLYTVVARRNDGVYALWTSWNETMQSLNGGNYDIKSFADARILQNYVKERMKGNC